MMDGQEPVNVVGKQKQMSLTGAGTTASEEAIRNEVWSVLGALYPQGGQVERRVEQRYPYPYLIHLIPTEEDGTESVAEPVVVVGKHLSEGGLAFYHPKPLPYRRMIVELNLPDSSTRKFMIDITWCRFTEHGWYESGGRFLQCISGESETQTESASAEEEDDFLT